MAYSSDGHGAGRGRPHVETLGARDQPVGVPAPSGAVVPLLPAVERRPNGTLADRTAAQELGRRGGRARAERARQLKALTELGLLGATPDALRPYLGAAEEFARAEVERLARECGGGVCPANAVALVQAGARAMAGSCAAYAAGDAALGAKLGAELRSNLMAAREMTVKEAKARPKADPLAEVRARVAEQARRAREEREGSK